MSIKILDHVFREYDIRGVVGEELSEDFAYLLGLAFADYVLKRGCNTCCVGYDARISSPSYADHLITGLKNGGLSTVSLGMCATPEVYFATVGTKKFDSGICVTGSHNPSNMNGFKLCVESETLFGESIQTLKNKMLDILNSKSILNYSLAEYETITLREDYVSNIVEDVKQRLGERNLRVVVDAGNGVAGLAGVEILRSLGVGVIELFCEPNGHFPNHHPDPTIEENLRFLVDKVLEVKADCGIGWDGDGDRIGAVDEKGKIVYGDMLLLLFAKAILTEPKNKGAGIIGDVKCSDVLFDTVKELGGNPIMSKTGHSLIKQRMKETGALLAGEMSGHIFFKDRYFGYDDALYASARLIEILTNEDKKLGELLAQFPRMVSTPEIRIECDDDKKFRVIEEIAKFFSDYEVVKVDGVRVKFAEGWGLARASNTQPAIVLRFEARSEKKLEEIRGLFEEAIQQALKRIN